jgi:hypothetical protein
LSAAMKRDSSRRATTSAALFSTDRHRTAKTKARPGEGDRGDGKVKHCPGFAVELASKADKSFKRLRAKRGMSLKCFDQFPDRPDWSVLCGHLHCDLAPVRLLAKIPMRSSPAVKARVADFVV